MLVICYNDKKEGNIMESIKNFFRRNDVDTLVFLCWIVFIVAGIVFPLLDFSGLVTAFVMILCFSLIPLVSFIKDKVGDF